MGTLLTILIVWFLLSVVVGLILGRVLASANDTSEGRRTLQRSTPRETHIPNDTVTAQS